MKNKIAKIVFYTSLGIVGVLVLLWIVFIKTYTIPTGSMEGTLPVNSYIVTNKWNKTPQNLDIVVYLTNKWNDDKIVTPYISRCIAMAGDTLEIKNAKVFINSQKQVLPPKAKLSYIISSNQYLRDKILEKYNVIPQATIPIGNNQLQVFANPRDMKRMKQDLDFVTVESNTLSKGEEEQLFSEKEKGFVGKHNWNRDNLGALIIPKKGMKIKLTPQNYETYAYTIQHLEKVSVKVGQTYVFKQNYYFFMGDNRHNSLDSRYIGLIPEKDIIGKLWFVL